MTEQQGGGDKLGTLEVDIVGMLSPLEAALQRAEQMLTDFDTKWMKRAREMGGGMGRGVKSRYAGTGGAAQSSRGETTIEGKAKVSGKVSAEGVELKINKTFLRQQVMDALAGIEIKVGASVTGMAAPSPEQMRRMWPPDLLKALKNLSNEKGGGNLTNAINDLHDIIGDSFSRAGSSGFGALPEGAGAIDKMAQIMERFGIQSGKIVEFVDESGKKGKTTGGPLGPGSPHLSGLDPGDVKEISTQARIVQELSSKIGFLSNLAEAIPNTPSQPMPDRQGPREITTDDRFGNRDWARGGEALARPIADAVAAAVEGSVAGAGPEQARQFDFGPKEREELGRAFGVADMAKAVRDIAARTGTPVGGQENLPKAGEIAVPASFFKNLPGGVPKGALLEEELQAAKSGAGRKQGIQGGLGPITAVLQAAERGAFLGVAEETKNGRGTGVFRNFDPASRQGQIIQREGYGFLGEDDMPVRRANPKELLGETLKALFPGIEQRSNPTDPGSSVLERVLAGPGRLALEAGKRLAFPSRGSANPEDMNPEQTSSAPGGGLYAPGSAGSLRRSLIDAAKETAGLTQDQIIQGLRLASEQSKVSGAENRARVQEGTVAESTAQRLKDEREMEKAMGQLGGEPGFGAYSAVMRRAMASTGVGREGEPESFRSVGTSGPGPGQGGYLSGEKNERPYTRNIVRDLFTQVDEELFDAFQLEGNKRKAGGLPMWVQAERAAVQKSIYDKLAEAESIQDRGGGGYRPKNKAGEGFLTGRQTAGGALEVEQEFERPSTSLDVERQQLRGRASQEEASRKVQMQQHEIEAARIAAAKFGGKEMRTRGQEIGIDAYSWPNSGAMRGATEMFNRSMGVRRAYVNAGGSGTSDRLDEIERIQRTADEFVDTLTKPGLGIVGGRALQGPSLGARGPIPADRQKMEAQNAGLDPEVLREVHEILGPRLAQAARRPSVRDTGDPPTSDQFRDKFTGGSDRFNSGGGGGGRGVGVGDGGGFVPGGAPIEVIVVGKFPLPVEIMGGSAGAGDTPGKARKNVRDKQSSGGAWRTSVEWVPEGSEEDPIRYVGGKDVGVANSPREAGMRRLGQNRRRAVSSFNKNLRGPASRESRQDTYERLFAQQDRADAAAAKQAEREAADAAKAAEDPFKQAEERARTARAAEQFRAKASARAAADQRRQEAEGRRIRRQATRADPVGVAREQDAEDELQRELRGQLRSLNRRIPRRGFGASLTDLVSSAAPGRKSLERQLEFGDLAAREAQQISRVSGERAQTQVARRGLRSQILAAEPGSLRQKELIAAHKEQTDILRSQNIQIRESTANFKRFRSEVVGTGTVLRSFGAAAAGATVSAAAGSVQFGLAMAITGPLIQAIAEGFTAVVAPAVERATGFAGTTARVSGELGDATRAAGGRGEIAVAQRAVTSGLADSTRARIGPTLQLRAETEAGNKALQEQIDLLHASQRIQAENAGLGGFDKGLVATTGGQFGTQFQGVASTVELLGKELKSIKPPTREAAELRQNLGLQGGIKGPLPGLLELDEQGLSKLAGINLREPQGFNEIARIGPTSRKGISTERLSPEEALAESTLKFFNDAAEKGGSSLRFVANEALAAETALKASNAGLHTFAQQILESGVGIEGLGGKPEDLLKFLEAINKGAPKPTAGALLAANQDQLKASIQARQERLRLTTGTLIPAGVGLEAAVSGPLNPAATGINTSGASPQQVKALNSELANTQKLYDQVNAEAAEGQKIAVDFVQKALPGQLGGNQFAASLAKVADYGKQIAAIQFDVSTKQAAYQAQQYAVSINIAKRSLQDAKELVSGIGDGLGAVERRMYDLNRESQALGLELSQRQINFQLAVANFQAPGLSSEERQARKEAAKIEAEYAQKQLDIQKKLFGLSGQQFDISSSRQVSDLTAQLGLLEQGRAVSLDTAAAEKKIIALTKLQANENAKVQAYYAAAVEATNDIIGLTQELASATGKDMSELANDVVQAYAKVYRGLIAVVQDENAKLAQQTYNGISDTNSESYGGYHAQGGMWNVSGPTNLGIAGEAGNETVAILRNPRPFFGNAGGGSAGGGAPQISILVTGNTVRNDKDLDDIARKVSEKLNQTGALLGLRPFGG